MSSDKKISKDIKYYMHSAIGLLLMFGFGHLPPIAPITEMGMSMVGIMLGLVYLWTFIDMGWPSIAALLAMILNGSMTIGEITQTGFGNSTVWLIFFCTMVTFAIHSSGVFDYFIPWLLNTKAVKGRPWILTIIIFVGTFLLTTFGSGIAMMLVIWEIVYAIGKQVGMQGNHPWIGSMVVGTALATVCGQFSMTFKGSPLFVFGLYGIQNVPFITYMLFMWIFILLLLGLHTVAMKFILRIDVACLKEADTSSYYRNLPPMKKEQKVCAAIFMLFILSLLVVGSATIYPDGTFKTFCLKIGAEGIALFFFIVCAIYQVNNRSVLRINEIVGKQPWESIFLLVVAFTFATKLAAPETGIPTLMTSISAPLLAGHSPYVFLAILGITTLLATNIFNNTVVIMLVYSFAALYVGDGVDLAVIATCQIITTQIAFLLPSSSIFGSFVYGQAKDIGSSIIVKNAVIIMVLVAVLTLIYVIPVAPFIFI